jgi:hypothetical protein
MRKVIALLLVCMVALAACAQPKTPENTPEPAATASGESYTELSDPALLLNLKDTLYTDLVDKLGTDSFIENVEAIYLSKEYIEELEYNSQENIYFGYTLSELEEQFQGTKYIFTLGENGETTVKAFEAYDDTYEKVIKNVAIGTGVILLCVTISVASGGAGAPAACMIFAASAKAGAIGALTGATFSGAVAGIATGVQTGDFEQAKKAAALSASEGFMWGGITGVIAGGATKAIGLRGATLNGLKMNEAAAIQQESKLPLSFIKNFRSVEEYNIYKGASLVQNTVNGKPAFIRKINLDYVDEFGRTNAQRISKGFSPLDDSGSAYELHHIGQKVDSPLAVLTKAEHMQGGNNTILHNTNIEVGVHQEIGGSWSKQVSEFWKDYLAAYQKGLL